MALAFDRRTARHAGRTRSLLRSGLHLGSVAASFVFLFLIVLGLI